mgnify:CR=1 FL=1
MVVSSEAEMLSLGKAFAERLKLPAVVELIGDVGTGKTTFTRGLADGLGVNETVTSPSFTISKRYVFDKEQQNAELIHYDFYRLDDPGIMREELDETLSQQNAIVVLEWAGDVADLLPESKYRLEFVLNEDNTREIIANGYAQKILESIKL